MVSILGLIVLLSTGTAMAQTDQLERDIRIAERIIEEIFAADMGEHQMLAARTGTVQGEYIKGVGVHFSIGHQRLIRFSEGAEGRINSGWQEMDLKILTDRAVEYLTGYGTQLRGLQENEQIRITYGAASQDAPFIIIRQQGRSQRAVQPQFSAWIRAGELNEVLNRGGAAEDVQAKLSVIDLYEIADKRDFEIFASVLETALNRTDLENLSSIREPGYQYHPGLGVHYQINVRSRSGFSLNSVIARIDEMDLDDVRINIDLGDITDQLGSDIRVNTPSVRIERDSVRVDLERFSDSIKQNLNGVRAQIAVLGRDSVSSDMGAMIGRRLEFNFAANDTIDLSVDAAKMIDELTSVLKDYAGTLSSLKDDEIVMITINWPVRNQSLPAKTRIRATKEDLFFGREPLIEEVSRR